MVSFIDEHREKYGVEPIRRHLPIAPSTYREQESRQANPSRVPVPAVRDAELRVQIERVFGEKRRVYGEPKIWRQLNRKSVDVAPSTAERLMREIGLECARCGKKHRITIAADSTQRPPDLVDRKFEAQRPDQLWVADLTYGAPSPWRRPGRRCQGSSMSGMYLVSTGRNGNECPLSAAR